GIGCLLAETEGESLVDTMSTANSVNSGLDCASPESIMDPTNLNAVGDQYSLGCVMYYCLAGRYPFPDGTAVEKMMCHQHKQPTPLKDLPPAAPDAVIAIGEKLMAKTPAERYRDCDEVIDVLRSVAGVSNAPTRRPTMTMPRVKIAPRGNAAPELPPPAAPRPPAPQAPQRAPPLPPRAPPQSVPRPPERPPSPPGH